MIIVFLGYIYPILTSIIPTCIFIIYLSIQAKKDKKDRTKKRIVDLTDTIIEYIRSNELVEGYFLAMKIDSLKKNIDIVTKKKEKEYRDIPEQINDRLQTPSFEEYLITKKVKRDNKKDIEKHKRDIINILRKLSDIAE